MGVAGVSREESAKVQRKAFTLELIVVLVTFSLPFVWYAETKGLVGERPLLMMDAVVWGAYVLELLVLSVLVSDRPRYWRENWFSIFIVLAGIPLIFFNLPVSMMFILVIRLLLFTFVMVRVARQSLRMMARHALAGTLLMAVFLTLSIGTMVATVDPAFNNLWDGLWWALVTIATVGYGDFVPVSAEGRLLGVVLILFGVVTFSMLTANAAAFLVKLQAEEFTAGQERESKHFEQLLMCRLDAMEARFERLEQHLLAISEGKPADDEAKISAAPHSTSPSRP